MLVLARALIIVGEQRRQTSHTVGRRTRLRSAYLHVLLVVQFLHLFYQLRRQVYVGLEELVVERRVGIPLPEILFEEVQAVTELYAILQVLDVLLCENFRAPLAGFEVDEFGPGVPCSHLRHFVVHEF